MSPGTFKQLTFTNLLDPDPVALAFGHSLDLSTGEVREMSCEEFVLGILEPRMTEWVPQDIRDVFEAGRGAMCYGYYFYPLFMMGFEQSCRAAETAANHKTRLLKGPSKATFNERIEFLTKAGAITETERVSWHAIRLLRNDAAHPKFRQLAPPGPCLDGLAMIANTVNGLFRPPST